MSDIDVGQLSEAINDKMDRDLGNTSPLARTVVEVSDKSLMPSWYRVYSDGWCEQGNRFSGNGSSTEHTVTFVKPFLTNSYNAVATCTAGTSPCPIYNILSAGFKTLTNQSGTHVFCWRASGYIS